MSFNLWLVWQGKESFASYESLEQLHRFVFVLGITHVSYSFVAVALAMIKVKICHDQTFFLYLLFWWLDIDFHILEIIQIYSWRSWENEAKTIAVQSLLGSVRI